MTIKRFAAIFGVLSAAIFIVAVMIKFKPQAERSVAKTELTTVDVYEIHPGPWPTTVTATGLVSPAREIVLSPQVTGSILWTSPNLMPGGRFAKDELLARIDPRDFEIAVQQEKSKLRAAELELEQESARQGIAQKEWELLGNEKSQHTKELALRKPQLAVATMRVQAAQSALDKAQLNHKRTWLRAPFDASVVNETLDVGQLVGPSSRAAHLIGTEEFWVKVAVPVSALEWIHPTSDALPSTATITQEIGQGKTVQRQGRVLRLITQLNPQTRRAEVLVAIENPMEASRGIPLLPGAFVTVTIEGAPQNGVLKVPRAAVRGGDTVWVVKDNKLTRMRLTSQWATKDALFTVGGLNPGDQVLLTPVSLPVEGMEVQIRNITQEDGTSFKTALSPETTSTPQGSQP